MDELFINLTGYGTRLQHASFALCGYCEPVSLPLWLESRYELMTGEWFGKWRVFALEKGTEDQPSPGEYRTHQQKLSQGVGKAVILVIEKLPAYARDRMVEMGIPFISPYAQAFIPEVVMDLTEKFPGKTTAKTQFTPTAQLALLYHLLQDSLEECSGKAMAEKLGCSPMMAGKVREEFEQAGLGKPVRHGRSVHFKFAQQGKELWGAALSQLRSPVQHHYFVEEDGIAFPTFRSGLSALSDMTMIQDDVCETRAMGEQYLNREMESGTLIEIEDRDMATLKLEKWIYDPERLTSTSRVDPLSLWLSLRKHPDERVQGELNTLMEQVPWL